MHLAIEDPIEMPEQMKFIERIGACTVFDRKYWTHVRPGGVCKAVYGYCGRTCGLHVDDGSVLHSCTTD